MRRRISRRAALSAALVAGTASAAVAVSPDAELIQLAERYLTVSSKTDAQYLLPPDVWREVCGEAGIDPTDAARTLRTAVLLEAGDSKNLTRPVRVPGMGLVRCYVVKPEILGKPNEEAAA